MRPATELPGEVMASLGALVVIGVGAAMTPLRDPIGNTSVALVLVVVVLAAAVGGGRVAGAVTAVAAGLSFNFFHTRPFLSLTIAAREDVITTVLLVVVGVAIGELALLAAWSRREAAEGRGGLHRVVRVAELVTAGKELDEVRSAVEAELVAELRLRDARFEPGAPTPGGRARCSTTTEWSPANATAFGPAMVSFSPPGRSTYSSSIEVRFRATSCSSPNRTRGPAASSAFAR